MTDVFVELVAFYSVAWVLGWVIGAKLRVFKQAAEAIT